MIRTTILILTILIPSILLSATLTVTNTNDIGSGSLRQAIIDANSVFGLDLIVFNIPTSDPNFDSNTGVWTIAPLSDLPMITGGYTTIDATMQPHKQQTKETRILLVLKYLLTEVTFLRMHSGLFHQTIL